MLLQGCKEADACSTFFLPIQIFYHHIGRSRINSPIQRYIESLLKRFVSCNNPTLENLTQGFLRGLKINTIQFKAIGTQIIQVSRSVQSIFGRRFHLDKHTVIAYTISCHHVSQRVIFPGKDIKTGNGKKLTQGRLVYLPGSPLLRNLRQEFLYLCRKMLRTSFCPKEKYQIAGIGKTPDRIICRIQS